MNNNVRSAWMSMKVGLLSEREKSMQKKYFYGSRNYPSTCEAFWLAWPLWNLDKMFYKPILIELNNNSTLFHHITWLIENDSPWDFAKNKLTQYSNFEFLGASTSEILLQTINLQIAMTNYNIEGIANLWNGK